MVYISNLFVLLKKPAIIKTYSCPSVYESTLRDFATSNNPILGFSKLKYDGAEYLVGLQALNEGISPHKFINPSPEEIYLALPFNTKEKQ